MIPLTGIAQYYNNFRDAKGYKSFIWLAARGVSSSELNEVQDIAHYNTRSVFDSLFKNGSLLRGGAITIKNDSASVEEGMIYANGYPVSVPKKSLTIPTIGEASLGVLVSYAIITSEADPDLLDPATGTSNFGSEGANRLQVVGKWAMATDPRNEGDEFYAIYTLLNGTIKGQEVAAPEMQFSIDLVAKYDKAAHGSYVSEGMHLTFLSYKADENLYDFSLSEGLANVDGYRITNVFSRQLSVPGLTDVRAAVSEPFTFVTGTNIYKPRFKNIKAISRLVVVKDITVTMTHGNAAGASDLLPKSPVVAILSVKQGATTYTVNSDFTLTGDYISWAPPGLEPAPGSTYEVKLRYQDVITDLAPNSARDSFDVSAIADLANGQVMNLDYEYYLGRTDLVLLKQDGDISILRGAPDYYNPTTPPAPSKGLVLASVALQYGGDPQVKMLFHRAFRMSDIQKMEADVSEIRYNVARLSLLDKIRSNDPASNKLNLFADPLLDNALRDEGTGQTLVIGLDNALHLPVTSNIFTVTSANRKNFLLPYTNVQWIAQAKRTGSRKINEFANIQAPPASLSISPASYTYVAQRDQRTVGSSPPSSGSWWVSGGVSTSSRTTAIDSPQPLPQVALTVNADLFGYNETVDAFFDGIPCGSLTANAQGKIVNGVITTPVNATSGPKLLTLRGRASGSEASTGFISFPQLVTTTSTRTWWWSPPPPVNTDPLAQTFLNREQQYLSTLSLLFKVKPTAPVTVAIVGTQVGQPDRNDVLGSKVISPEDINLNNQWTTVTFDSPIFLDVDEYAILITSTESTGQLAVAKLGSRDEASGIYVTTQPYPDGVLLNSANASTWSAIQDEDLTFLAYKAGFALNGSGTMGEVNAVNHTDLLLSASVRAFPGTFVSFTAVLLDRLNETYVISPGVPLQFPKYTGRIRLNYAMTTNNPNLSAEVLASFQVVLGTVANTGDYVTRAFPVNGNTLTVLLDEIKDSNSNIQVFYKNSTGWVALNRDAANAKPAAEGLTEAPYKVSMTSLVNSQTQIRIVFSSTDPASRPRVKNIRAYVTS